LPLAYLFLIAAIIALYIACAEVSKRIFYRKFARAPAVQLTGSKRESLGWHGLRNEHPLLVRGSSSIWFALFGTVPLACRLPIFWISNRATFVLLKQWHCSAIRRRNA